MIGRGAVGDRLKQILNKGATTSILMVWWSYFLSVVIFSSTKLLLMTLPSIRFGEIFLVVVLEASVEFYSKITLVSHSEVGNSLELRSIIGK